MGIGSKLKSAVKQSPLGPLLIRRRFHAYCLGPPKTGTTSVSALFRDHYRSAHEPTGAGTMAHVIAAYEGTEPEAQSMAWLRWRDRELMLEMESSHPMTGLAGLLARTFPEARVVLCVRDPRSWLDSIVNMRMTRAVHRFSPVAPSREAQFFRTLNRIYFEDAHPTHPPEEEILRVNGLFSLDGYLTGWTRYYREALSGVPADRLLVLDIEELSTRPERLADFLGVPLASMTLERSHSHVGAARHGIVDSLDQAYLEHKIELHCAPMLEDLRRRIPA